MPKDSVHEPKSQLAQVWVKAWRKVYHPLGFKKGYNFPLFVILVGALMGFVLARLQYLSINGIFLTKTIPGDAVHYQTGTKRVGIILHLGAILPAGFLVCFQFVPVIRHKVLLFHRLNGYVIILLLLVGNAGAYIIIPVAAGGSPSTQVALGLLAAITTISTVLAYVNIKCLQIDQHRAWMIRTWVYAGSIISVRLIMMAANTFMAQHQSGHWYDVQSCADIWAQYTLYGAPAGEGNPTPYLYPQCTGPNASVPVAVKANINGMGPESTTASFHLTFGMALWLSLAIHAIGVEVYLQLTPAETERLRLVSYEKQVEAGFKRPGRAGLTVDRFGDAPAWKPINHLEMDDSEGDSK
ncbi:uncharacterized protein Z518_03278 [Rhinocladiella mackenziei CBS 650.93]|uniref:Uncharacterized protein n=1 Tax=Rhinocladiella mackenziei CBS 650.93 TaxID=1442369 RepID=A0A0D2G282_9EURO|nr:uncharacterized protein Z518_03278 [Rhinocladiella mackenziei CBS 650.93]KIX08622.1 hypothetical protein Z518_03278 [Rhinocladiella mackenziei CBS 650.93]